MTVSSSTNRVSYSGNGTLTTFAYTFKVFDQGDLTVILRASNGAETVQTITTDYTVTGVGDVGGGNVVFTTAPTATETVVILREQGLTQGLDLVPNDPFPAQSLEESLDKLTFMVQQHNEELGRAIKASRTNVITGSEFTISAADRANKVFSFDASGDLAVTQELGVWQGDWATSTAFSVRDIVKDASNNNVYICITAHTSSGSTPISTNTDSAKWALLVDAASASSSATAAAASETAAEAAQTAAEAAQTAAETAQTAAETAETNAETAQTAAETAKADAETAQAAAELAYDNFDDRYLGAKASDPTLDNDGDALIDGALYFDTTNNVMKVYDLGGTAWNRTTPTSAEQTNIDTVSGISANVTTVAGISSNVTTVAGISSDVTTVAADGTDIGTVATNITNVNTVAGISGNVTTVAGISADVSTVAADGTDIGTVAGISSDVTTVSGISANVTTVAGISANVTTVAGISANVTTVAGDTANIGTIATDLDGDDHIGTVAGSISNVNSVGGSIANVNTVATNLTSVNSFANVYRVGATDPTTSLDTGDLFYNTTSSQMKVYNGSAWETGVIAGSGFMPTTGGTFTGDVSFGDNDKAIFGAGSDLQIYHDSATGHSIITESGSGALQLRGENLILEHPTTGNNYLLAVDGASGYVKLYHNGSDKLATTSTGIDVTGTVTADGLTVDVTSIIGQTLHNSAGVSVYTRYQNNSGNDNYIGYTGNNFDVFPNNTKALSVASGGDISFYEDTGTTAKFFWDASAESLGIGTTSPSAVLHANGSSQGDVYFRGETGSTKGLLFSTFNVNATDHAGHNINAVSSVGEISFSTGSTERMRIDSSGNVGIGTTNPVVQFAVGGAGRRIEIVGTDGVIRGYDRTSSWANIEFEAAGYIFDVNASEAMRIDSSGNLLVGKTSTALGLAGVVAYGGSGAGVIGMTSSTRPLYINKLTSDGGIIELAKDGTTVGSIGTEGSGARLYINQGDTGIGMQSSIDSVIPVSSNGGARNNAVDLGYSTVRFKDLYLSGGVVETTTTVTYASSIALTYDNGSIQTVTLTGNVEFTDSLADGEAIVLMLNAGASHTVTWTIVDKWVSSSGNAAPTLTANDTIVLWKIGTTVYAAYAGSFT
jgi:hypothetical protein